MRTATFPRQAQSPDQGFMKRVCAPVDHIMDAYSIHVGLQSTVDSGHYGHYRPVCMLLLGGRSVSCIHYTAAGLSGFCVYLFSDTGN